MTAIYLREFENVARLSWSMWNRDPASPSYGSFDRLYWGWKFKDISDASLQAGVVLALEYARRRGATATLPDVVEGFARFCRSIQHPNGSFDQCYPNEHTPGVVYDLLSALRYVRNSGYLGTQGKAELTEVIERAVHYAVRSDELHGEVANHLANYAYELYAYADETGSPEAKAKADGYVNRLMAGFDREEGWFNEYNGADLGYQTRCMRYLAKMAQLGRDDLWEVLERAARFSQALLMPDGSAHPMLGVRSTALVYPSAFEILARRDSRHAALASAVRKGWERAAAPLPTWLDFPNALRLAEDARDALDNAAKLEPDVEKISQASVSADFPRAGLHVRRTPDRAVYVSSRLGGVVVAYRRNEQGNWQLGFEDSGYQLEPIQSGPSLVSRSPDAALEVSLQPGSIEVHAEFVQSLHEELTPLKQLLLRVLNLTVLRSQRAGDVFRRLVVRRLMTGVRSTGVVLKRRIQFEPLQIEDRLEGRIPEGLRLFRVRRLTSTHMASSRYFQDQELDLAVSQWRVEIQRPAPDGRLPAQSPQS